MEQQLQIDASVLLTIIGDKEAQLFILRRQIVSLSEELNKLKLEVEKRDG